MRALRRRGGLFSHAGVDDYWLSWRIILHPLSPMGKNKPRRALLNLDSYQK